MKTADYQVWLAIPPDQRDIARADAGKHPDGGSAIAWDKNEQLWYARPGADLSRLNAWLPDRSIRSSGGGDPQSEFLDALTSAGLVLDGLPIMDGKRHRVSVIEGKKGNRDGVYRGFLDGIKPGGCFINYHRAYNDKDITKWKASGSTGQADPVARMHIRAVMRQSQDDAARSQAALYVQQTAKALALISRMANAEPGHAYLVRKGVTAADDIRLTNNGALAIPLYNVDGEFRTLQYIPPEGQKYLFADAPKAGHFRVEGEPIINGEPILYAEGYATARSLHMVTGRPVVMTVDAGNMQAVGEILKARFPDSPHLFMADIDHQKDKNKGLISAQRAAAKTGGAVIAPVLRADEIEQGFTDFNDLHQSRGTDALRTALLPQINEALSELNYKEPLMATSDDASQAPGNIKQSEQAARRPGAAKAQTHTILKLHDEGLKPSQIAKELGIGQTSVYRILKSQASQTIQLKVAAEPEPATAESIAVSQETSASKVSKKSDEAVMNSMPLSEPAAAMPVLQEVSASGAEDKSVSPDSGTSFASSLESVPAADPVSEATVQSDRLEFPYDSSVPAVGELMSEEPLSEPVAHQQEPQTHQSQSQSVVPDEDNAILVGARRVVPQPEDKIADNASRIDQDKLLSRLSHERHPDGKSVIYSLDNTPPFIDRGNRLVMAEGSSSHEEMVLAALLSAAKFYHGKIELTGSDEFKAFAINIIVNNELQVSMKNPSQQLALDEAKRLARQTVNEPDMVRGDPEAASVTTAFDPVTPDTPISLSVTATTRQASPVTQMAAPVPSAGSNIMPAEPLADATISSPMQSTIRPDIHTPAEKAREPVTGKVTAHGQAPFRFEPGNQESVFITLRTREGTQTFWGKELAGLIRDTRLTDGQMVTLQWMGQQPVTINKPIKDSQGNFTGDYEPVQTKRNQWALTSKRGSRVQTGGDEMLKLSAFSANRYAQIQHTVVSQLGITLSAPPKPTDGLYWFRPDGQGSSSTGDALSAPRPEHNPHAGKAVMSAWGADGQPDLYLVQGDGQYLQGILRQGNTYQHVLANLPDSKDAPKMVINVLTPDGAKPVGSGNGINRSDGQPVPREHVAFRVTGDESVRIAKLLEPASIPPALHARLGYDERYKNESVYSKEQPAAAPQAAPAMPRPAQ